MPWTENLCDRHQCPLTGWTTLFCPRCEDEAAPTGSQPVVLIEPIVAGLIDGYPRYHTTHKSGASVTTWGELYRYTLDPTSCPIHTQPGYPYGFPWVVGDFLFGSWPSGTGALQRLARFCIEDHLVVSYFIGLLKSATPSLSPRTNRHWLHFSGQIRQSSVTYPDGLTSDILVHKVRVHKR